MDLIEYLREEAKKNPQKIVLPEGEDERILRAAEISAREKFARPILLGNEQDVKRRAADLKVNLENIEIINPSTASELDRYVTLYCNMRKKRAITDKIARRILVKNLYFGAMMVHAGDASGMVAGAVNLTASVIRAGVLIMGLQKGISLPSSFMIMDVPNFAGGENGILIFADAAVNVNPTPAQLADIAISTARSAQSLLDWEPRVAMLSFSTKGSAFHPLTKKVIEATEIARKKAPYLLIDGELQADAAIIPEIAKRKVKESNVAGRANILIFPDLNAGNIAYKIAQYLGKAKAYGPILQGFAKPISDLSRGASVEDVAGVIAIISVLAQRMESKK